MNEAIFFSNHEVHEGHEGFDLSSACYLRALRGSETCLCPSLSQADNQEIEIGIGVGVLGLTGPGFDFDSDPDSDPDSD